MDGVDGMDGPKVGCRGGSETRPSTRAKYDLDDIVVVGGSMGATTTTFTYTDANELATQTVNGVTTAFTYDAWGRMVEKAVEGGPSATYEYRYGDKLYGMASTFPGEATVTSQYRGDGKRL